MECFGANAAEVPLGRNYSGPYKRRWEAQNTKTPLQFLKEYLGEDTEVVYSPDSMEGWQRAVRRRSILQPLSKGKDWIGVIFVFFRMPWYSRWTAAD